MGTRAGAVIEEQSGAMKANPEIMRDAYDGDNHIVS
jgi:hypothetical protein